MQTKCLWWNGDILPRWRETPQGGEKKQQKLHQKYLLKTTGAWIHLRHSYVIKRVDELRAHQRREEIGKRKERVQKVIANTMETLP